MKLIKSSVLLFGLFTLFTAHAIELMKWERIPLTVPLYVNQERIIFVDSNVRIGVPSSLTRKLRVQSTGGTIYLKALEPIEQTRLQLQDTESGALILIDISAKIQSPNTTSLEPIQIVDGRSAKNHKNNLSQSQKQGQNGPKITETPEPVILTRYAAQNLYAPLRTVEPVQGISRVNLNRKLNLNTLLPMLPVNAHAIAAWRLNDYFVTAVMIKNTSNKVITLDARLLQGNFIAATFQHSDVGPIGDSTDTTIVYLITKTNGLTQSLLPSISQINAQSNLTGGKHEK